MRRRVVVTGMGCISPVGNTVNETWSALLAGKSGAGMITHFDAAKHKTQIAAEVKGFDAVALFGNREARKMDRFTQFAAAAAMEALEHSELKIDESNRDRVGILIGTGIGGIGTLLEQVEVMRERGADRIGSRIACPSTSGARPCPACASPSSPTRARRTVLRRAASEVVAHAAAAGDLVVALVAPQIVRAGLIDDGNSGAYVVALLMGGLAATFAVLWLRNGRSWARIVATVLAIMAVASLFFINYFETFWPVALILGGAYLLYTALRKSKTV